MLTKGCFFSVFLFSSFPCSNLRPSSRLKTQKLVFSSSVAVACRFIIKCIRRVYSKMQTMLSVMGTRLWRNLNGDGAKHCFIYLWPRVLNKRGVFTAETGGVLFVAIFWPVWANDSKFSSLPFCFCPFNVNSFSIKVQSILFHCREFNRYFDPCLH